MMKNFVCLILSLTLFGAAHAQPSFTAEVDTNKILIGEQIKLQLQAEFEAGQKTNWPVLPDTLTGLEIVKTGKIDSVENSGQWKLTQELLLTSFDSGYAVVPPLSLQIGEQSLQTEAIGIAVGMPQVSEEEGFFDIKGPLEAPTEWWPIIVIALGIILLGVGIWYLIYYLRQRKAIEQLTPEQKLSPYEYALKQLQDVKNEKLWQNGHIKEYYSRLTDIIRLYMERQMGLNAMESTADEVVDLVNELRISSDLRNKVKDLMGLSVLVKYAKQAPGPEDHQNALEAVEQFLEENKPEEQEDAEYAKQHY